MGLQETQLNELGTHLDHWQDRADLAASFPLDRTPEHARGGCQSLQPRSQ